MIKNVILTKKFVSTDKKLLMIKIVTNDKKRYIDKKNRE